MSTLSVSLVSTTLSHKVKGINYSNKNIGFRNLSTTVDSKIEESQLDYYAELISEGIVKFAYYLKTSEQNIVKLTSLLNIIDNNYKSKSNSKEINSDLKQIIVSDKNLSKKTANVMSSLDLIHIFDDFVKIEIYRDRVQEYGETMFNLEEFKNKEINWSLKEINRIN